jgi:hypothetical protein
MPSFITTWLRVCTSYSASSAFFLSATSPPVGNLLYVKFDVPTAVNFADFPFMKPCTLLYVYRQHSEEPATHTTVFHQATRRHNPEKGTLGFVIFFIHPWQILL